MGKKKVNMAYIVLKIIMFVLIAFFATDAIMQFISYSFYSHFYPDSDFEIQTKRLLIGITAPHACYSSL